MIPYRFKTLSLLFFLSAITYLDRVCISVAGPRMQAELGITPEKWGWVIGAFTIGYALFEIPGGIMADRMGARRVLTRIVLFWSLFTVGTGAVTSFAMLLVVRLLFGAGEAGAFPAATSAISRWFPAQERSRAQAVVWMASRVGGILSAALVVPIQQKYGWRASFYVFGAVGSLWSIVWYLWYRDRPADKRGISAQELSHIGAKAAPGHTAVDWKSLMKKGAFWRLLFMYHAYCWGSFFYLGWLHTYLQKGRGFTEDQMRFWSMLPFIMGAIGNLTGGTVSDLLAKRHGLKFGRRVVGTTGLTMGALFLFGAAFTKSPTTAALCLAFGYFSMDCFLPVSWAVSLDLGKASAGSISGAMNMAGQAGSFLSSLAFGYLVKWLNNDYNMALIPLAVMTVVAAITFVGIDPTVPLVDEHGGPGLQSPTGA